MPKVFQIGLSGLGTRWLRRVFRSAGYHVASGESDRIAADICYAKRMGERPLEAYSSVDLFTDMESGRLPSEPPLAAQTEFAFLHQHYPDAYFLLNVGDFDSWLRHRAAAASGVYVLAAAHRLDVDTRDVPEIWRREWERQETEATDYFKSHERFMVFDVESQDLRDLAQLVSEHYDLTDPDLPAAPRRSETRSSSGTSSSTSSSEDQGHHHSRDFVDEVVDFATRTNPAVPPGMPWRQASRLYAYWDGSETVRGRYGKALPCAVDLSAPRWPFLLNRPDRKNIRTEGALNELWQHGGRRGAHVDMQDARRYGVEATGAPDSAVLTFCRLQGAANLVLWPLPGYHTPGAPDFPTQYSHDGAAFADKLDSLAWRGNLTGRALPELGPGGQCNEHATRLAGQLGKGRDPEVVAALETVPRYRVLSRMAGRQDADLGLVLGEKWPKGRAPDQIARLERPSLAYGELFRHRYLLSLSGNDSASNFLMVADSNSVVLREEDGWEWFYDGQFRPWEHYIPLARGGDDLEDRLDWARAHPRECQEMSRQAQLTVRRLVDARNRRDYLNGIREVYESRL